MINIITSNILYQNLTKDRTEYFEFHIEDEHGRPIDLNGDVLSLTLYLNQNRVKNIVKDIDIDINIVILIDLDLD